ncbi:hypothetical protein [Nocardiopsis baichengensis]|uniref:hypothetical protein n=1 Tax=Nocardiopsis baichengensis TaxID=280240 RepID=UPI00034B04A7|nr:hypothetical protein [Nocardiopsis baichengensis]
MADRIAVDPDAVAKHGGDLYALGDEVREIHRWLAARTETLGRPWGEGDKIATSFEAKYLPARRGLDAFFRALAQAFDKTAEGTIETARQFALSEQHGIDRANGLLGADGTGPGASGSGRR